MTALLIAALSAYLVGAIPFGVWIARTAAGSDPRTAGSGSTGATNVVRVAGWGPGLVTLALDAAKGSAAVLIADGLLTPGTGPIAAFAAVLGHVLPPWHRGTGGKGVATAAGALATLAPAPAGIAIAVFSGVLAWARIVSLASLAAAAAFPAAALLLGSSRPAFVAGLAIAGVIALRHRGNLARLRAGTEPRIGKSSTGDGA